MKKEGFWPNKQLSTRVFSLSLTVLTIIPLVFIATLYLILNPPSKKFYGTDGSPVTLAPVSFVLNVASPEDHSLVFSSSVLLQGKTSPGSTIITSFDDYDQVIPVNSKGDFNLTVKLQTGINEMVITAFDASGNSKSETRTIFYSKDKI